MYMLVFVTLVLGLVSIYAQVITVQTQRLAARQVGLASTMQQWHTAAMSMANSIYYQNGAAGPNTPASAGGCSLSNASQGLSACAAPAPAIAYDIAGTVTNGSGTPNIIYDHTTQTLQCVQLPSICTIPSGNNCLACSKAGYDATDYQFYSVYVQDTVANQSYVVTYVPPPTISASNPAPGYLTLAGGFQTSLTQADLMQQFVNAHIPNYTYGIVKGNVLTVQGGQIGGVPLTYSFTGLTTAIPDNSIAMIGNPTGL